MSYDFLVAPLSVGEAELYNPIYLKLRFLMNRSKSRLDYFSYSIETREDWSKNNLEPIYTLPILT